MFPQQRENLEAVVYWGSWSPFKQDSSWQTRMQRASSLQCSSASSQSIGKPLIELAASCRLKQRLNLSTGQMRLDQIDSLLHRNVTIEKAAGGRRCRHETIEFRSIPVETYDDIG